MKTKDKIVPLSEYIKMLQRKSAFIHDVDECECCDNNLQGVFDIEKKLAEAVAKLKEERVAIWNNCPVTSDGFILMTRTEIENQIRDTEKRIFGDFDTTNLSIKEAEE
ncbi:MAG: hypothetical protein WD512_09355 [Candidatus Paceibacterota bacterium]